MAVTRNSGPVIYDMISAPVGSHITAVVNDHTVPIHSTDTQYQCHAQRCIQLPTKDWLQVFGSDTSDLQSRATGASA